jgi:hypothetical protein
MLRLWKPFFAALLLSGTISTGSILVLPRLISR